MRWYVGFGWVLLVASLIGWPLCQFWLAKDEPPVVLALSWLAIALTALSIVVTAYVKQDQEHNGEGGS